MFEFVCGIIIEPMCEMNECAVECLALFGFAWNKIDAINVSDFESSKDGKDALVGDIGKHMWNANRRIVMIHTWSARFLGCIGILDLLMVLLDFLFRGLNRSFIDRRILITLIME